MVAKVHYIIYARKDSIYFKAKYKIANMLTAIRI